MKTVKQFASNIVLALLVALFLSASITTKRLLSRTRLELHQLPILCWSMLGGCPAVPGAIGGYRMLERSSARSTTARETSSLSSLVVTL